MLHVQLNVQNKQDHEKKIENKNIDFSRIMTPVKQTFCKLCKNNEQYQSMKLRA